MLSTTVRLLFFMVMLIVSTATADAEVLLPPTSYLPIAKDVIIKKYTSGQLLNLFKHTGNWGVKKVNKNLSIVGMSNEIPAYLISLDKLSKKPKSFMLDFVLWDKNKEYGFIYGESGVIVKNNKMYPAAFDSKANKLKIISNDGIQIDVEEGKTNTLDIESGYSMDGLNQECVMRINGNGLELKYSNIDAPFGVYIGPKNSISINNIRWGIGSK